MNIRRQLISFCLLWSICCQADTDLAMRALEHGDIISGYQQLNNLALSGDPIAQYNLGFLYYTGNGIPVNEEQAFFWFNLSARAGHAPAQDVLAYMYNHGKGTEKDKIRAYVWYSLAASNGIFLAQGIRKKLSQELGSIEMIQADLMVDDYMKHYLSDANE